MWAHGCIAVTDMRGQNDGHRRLTAVAHALAFEGPAHGAVVRHIVQHGVEDGILQCRGAVAVEQVDQGGGDGAEIGAVFGGAVQQDLAGRGGVRQAVIGAVLVGGVLGIDQCLHMGGVFDLLTAVVTAPVAGDHPILGNAERKDNMLWCGY